MNDHDWFGTPIAPALLQQRVQDDPNVRGYALGPLRRTPASLGLSFERYLAARLTVIVHSFEEIVLWLKACDYARDRTVFDREDVWLHPEDFERLRMGDCEDHALWGWVQFVRLGWNVRFTAGRHHGAGHAWITLYPEGGVRILESTAKGDAPLDYDVSVRPDYIPYWSVDGQARFYWHPHPRSTDIVFLE